jgi:hypothetical protein
MTVGEERQIVFFTGKSVVGVSAGDGKLRWRYPWETDHNCNIATPIIRRDEATGACYVFVSSGYGKGCGLLKVSGGDKVERVYENKRMRNHFPSSIVMGDNVYGFDESSLTCMDFPTGKQVYWEEKRPFGKGTLIGVGNQLIVLGETGHLGLVDAKAIAFHIRSSFRFSTKLCWSAPALAQGRLYVRDEEKIACYDLRNP